MRAINSFIALTGCFLLVVSLSCKNPFFPTTGIPRDTSRGSPEAVIKQLEKSYKNRRIDLFEDLLYSKEEFRFYIEQNEMLLDSMQKINPQQREQVVITKELDESFIVKDFLYIYLTYSEEVNIHRNMFRESDDIKFESAFESYNVQYFDTTIVSGDSLVLDTLEAVAYTDLNNIVISSQKLAAIYGEKEHIFPIGKQVFFMKKDAAGLWKIRLWFERKRK